MNKTILEKEWSFIFKNNQLEEIYNNYLIGMDRTSNVYAINEIFCSLVNEQKYNFKDIDKYKLSNDFDDGFTTIKSFKEIENSILNGDVFKLNRYQTIISFCTIFEFFIHELLELFSIKENEFKKKKLFVSNKEIHNLSLKALVYIHYHQNFESLIVKNISKDEFIIPYSHELEYYNKIIRIRNCIVHNHGFINNEWKNKLNEVGITANNIKNNYLYFDENQIDDYLHFFLMPIKGFIQDLDNKIPLSVS